MNASAGSPVPVWVNASGNAVSLSGLTPGLAYRLYLRATDVLGNVGPANTWTWRSEPCLSATEAVIQQLAVSLVSSGTRVASWSSVARPAAISGYSYAVDGGPWRVTPVPYVVLRGLQLGVTHVCRVKVALTPVCGDSTVSSVSWREFDVAPGLPSFAATPTSVSASAYASFGLASSAAPGTCVPG